MLDALVIIGMVAIYLAIKLLVPRFLVGKATKPVIFLLRKHGALSPQSAKSVSALGLSAPNFAQRMVRPRDYRQKALEVLIQTEIVMLTEDGKVYLCEERLAKTPLGQEIAQSDQS